MKIGISERRPGAFVMVLEGEVDMSTSPMLRKELLALFQSRAVHIVVDLKGVSYIDSSGVATLVEGLQLSRRGGARFVLAGAGRAVEAVFELAYLKNVFEMVPDAEALFAGEGEP